MRTVKGLPVSWRLAVVSLLLPASFSIMEIARGKPVYLTDLVFLYIWAIILPYPFLLVEAYLYDRRLKKRAKELD